MRLGVRLRPPDRLPAQAGFTLVEVMVATALVGLLMAALTSFFGVMVRQTNLSGGQQTAVQLATDGVEVIRAVPVANLRAAVMNANGRWIPPAATGSENPEGPVRNNVRFTRTWTVANCWQPATGGSCGVETAGYLPFLRVTVSVTWPDHKCAPTRCTFTTSTLVSGVPREPVFAP